MLQFFKKKARATRILTIYLLSHLYFILVLVGNLTIYHRVYMKYPNKMCSKTDRKAKKLQKAYKR